MIGKTIVAIAVALLLTAGSAQAKKVPPATMHDLAISWVGGTELEYLRLDLRPDGTGMAAIFFGVASATTTEGYRIRATKLVGYDVSFTLEPAGADAEPIYLRGYADRGGMSLTLGGTNGKWKREVVLEPLSSIMRRLSAVEQRIKQLSSTHE
jgi:hypothetical protein